MTIVIITAIMILVGVIILIDCINCITNCRKADFDGGSCIDNR
jgi:hypothetical protein